MGRIWMPGGGGGADLDVVTASASNILTGKVIVDKDGNPLTGTMPDNTGTALTVATNGKTLIPKGYHDGTQYATNTQATMAGGTKTPTTSAQTIACNGKLMTSNIVIPAFSLPAASSIKKGVTVTIYGKSVTGTWEGYVTSPLYLYNKGTWGGLNTTGVTIVSNPHKLKDTTSKFVWGYTGYVSASGVELYMMRLNQSFNLTEYKYIKVVECGGTPDELFTGSDPHMHKQGHVCVGVARSALSSVSAPSSVTGTPPELAAYAYGNGTVVLDVSSLTGNYWIYFGGIINQGTSICVNGLNQVFVSTS